jgi:putative peptide zinc metalloprotease protein
VADEADDTEIAAARQVAPPQAPQKESGYVPRLAEGLQLKGEFEGSGFKEGRYLVERGDGQIIQLTRLMYLVVENIDGKRTLDEIGERVSEEYGRTVSGDNVKTLIENSLYRDGIVPGPDGKVVELKKVDPMLRLKLRFTLVPERAVNVMASMLKPLFWPPVILAVLAGLVALDYWYFFVHGVGQGMRDTLYNPLTMLLLYFLLILSVGWHELGHATGCKYSGATPGKIGFGIYIIWPAFFTDVTDVYSVGKKGKVRTDLGGVYFNAIFSLAVGAVYFVTGFEPILTLIMIQHLLILYNFMPMLRLDGYFVIADSTGVPDLFSRIKPVLKSMKPGEEAPKQVTELKRGVRRVVTTWVLLTVPVLIVVFTMMVIHAPRVLATTWDSLFVQKNTIASAVSGGDIAKGLVGGIQSLILILPVGGMGVTAMNVVKRSAKGISNLYQRRPAAGMAVGLACVAALVFASYTLWPNGDYRPIQNGEKWTAGEAVAKAKDIPSGRPGLTEELEEELGGAPPVADEAIPDDSTGTGEETSSETEPTPEPSATSGSGESESNASPSPEASP